MARTKGTPNKKGHKAGGDRKSSTFKAATTKIQNRLSFQDKIFFNKKKKNFFETRNNVEHPLSKNNMKNSQTYTQSVLNHPSMPKSRNLPQYGTVLNDDDIDYTIDDNMVDDDVYYRRSYIPPPDSPLGIYLKNIMKKIKNCNILKEQQSIISTNSPITHLRGSPTPDKFYQNVVIYNYDPKSQYKGFELKYKCIECGGSELKKLAKRYRPAFSGGVIHWILYDRFKCISGACDGGRGKHRCFGTIDTKFIKQLPSPIATNFKYLFPPSGPGIELDMVRSMSIFTDKHVLFSAFANCINDLQWQNYYKQCNTYYYLLKQWLEIWTTVENKNDVHRIIPLECKWI